MDPTYYVITDGEKYWNSKGYMDHRMFSVYQDLKRAEEDMESIDKWYLSGSILRVQEINLYLGVPD